MSQKARQLGGQRFIQLTGATLTLTSTPVTGIVQAPRAGVVAMLQNSKLTDWVSTGEVWRPLGINVQATTTITVTAPVYTLQKGADSATTGNSMAAASSGGVATGTLQVAPNGRYFPFTTYVTSAGVSNFTADAAGDCWNVSVTTSPSAGAALIYLGYVIINVAGISDAITTL